MASTDSMLVGVCDGSPTASNVAPVKRLTWVEPLDGLSSVMK